MSNCDMENKEACAVERSINEMSCPVEDAVGMWNKSFFRAMGEVQVDVLKEKIRSTWGKVIDKEADAIVAAMGTQWQSILAQAKAQCDLRENIKKIYENAGK
jgi:hypothetical protein